MCRISWIRVNKKRIWKEKNEKCEINVGSDISSKFDIEKNFDDSDDEDNAPLMNRINRLQSENGKSESFQSSGQTHTETQQPKGDQTQNEKDKHKDDEPTISEPISTTPVIEGVNEYNTRERFRKVQFIGTFLGSSSTLAKVESIEGKGKEIALSKRKRKR